MENIDFMGSDPRSEFRGCEKFGPSAVSPPEAPDFRSAPRGLADRPAIGAGADRPAQPELLGRAGLVAGGTEAADVGVIVAAALVERHDVVGDGGFPNDAPRGAVPAEWLCP